MVVGCVGLASSEELSPSATPPARFGSVAVEDATNGRLSEKGGSAPMGGAH
jgi:hypothetical protein